LALPVLALARHRGRLGQRAVAFMLAVMIGVVSPALVRNRMVSRTFVPATTSVAVNVEVANLPNKAIYGLGGTIPWLVATRWAALLGMGFLIFGRVESGLHGPVRALPAMLSLSYFIVVTAIVPRAYGDRLILPFYVLLLPYAALGMTRAVDFVVPAEEQ
jgi:hypothetical protein